MGKVTGFLEVDRQDRNWNKIFESVMNSKQENIFTCVFERRLDMKQFQYYRDNFAILRSTTLLSYLPPERFIEE